MIINFQSIEKKWQEKWEKAKIFEVKESKKKKKYYCLEMFPYASGFGLHMGHIKNYSIGDIYARFKRMQGFNVLYPMGDDAFGLPAENAAIKAKIHPRRFTEKAIKSFVRQLKELGNSYDWSRMVITSYPEYYVWNQYFFLQLYKKGLVYRKEALVNWCPKCQTVLANEQVQNGKCWRHEDADVETRYLEQWFIKITAYAEELLKDLEKLKWPERIKIMQRNWIGKSYGTDINFKIDNEIWPVFTTRPDTIFGVTFMVISAQHPKLLELTSKDKKEEVQVYVEKCRKAKTKEEIESLEKEGVFTGKYATNPLTKEKVPVYAGNFVLVEYGSGMVMAVPAHDQRDFEFAKKYNLPIKIVIQPKGKEVKEEEIKEAYVEEGILVNSGQFSGLDSKDAIEKISDYVEEKKLGKRTIQYKLKDWLISRQRYWGTPIPMVYCKKCGIVPVPEKQLPILLPERVEFGKGNPLTTNKGFVNTKCPKCKGKAKRETDTMDTFFDSSWYFLRFCDPKNKNKAFDKKKVTYWMPVDQYIGGAEHACMHLIYARFFTKALRDLRFLNFDEPFIKLFNQGMLHKDGFVMSKSRGNIVTQEEVSKKYGIDTARLFLNFVASPEKDVEWTDEGIDGMSRFIKRIFSLAKKKFEKTDKKLEHFTNKTIKGVTEDIENFKFNLAVIKIMQYTDILGKKASKEAFEILLKLISPFCPHIAEELWHKIGKKTFISLEKWPKADESKIDEKIEKQEQQIQATIEDINHILKIVKEKQKKKPKKIYLYPVPKELSLYGEAKDMIKKSLNLEIEIFSTADKKKYDPQGKASKAKLEKPAIYVE